MASGDPITARGTVFFDGQCPLCLRTVRREGPMLRRRGFAFEPLQSPRGQTLFGPGVPDEMKLVTPDGRTRGGLTALLYLARSVWWLWPLGIVGELPGLRYVLNAIYRAIARHRGCTGDACPTHA